MPCETICRWGIGLLADCDCVGLADHHQFIGLAQAVAALFGVEFGEAEAGFGHLAGLGHGQRQLAAGAISKLGDEGGYGGRNKQRPYLF